MEEENIRHNVLKMLKLSSAAYIEQNKRPNNNKNAVSRSKIYLDEYAELMTSKQYIDTVQKSNEIRPTTLKASDIFKKRDCAGKYDISCKNNEVTDKNVEDLVEQFENNKSSQQKKDDIHFDKDFSIILSSNECSQSGLNDSVDLIVEKYLEQNEKEEAAKKNEIQRVSSDPLFSSSQSQSDDNSKEVPVQTPKLADVFKQTPKKSHSKDDHKKLFVNPFKKAKLEKEQDEKVKKPIADIFRKQKVKSPEPDFDSEYSLKMYEMYKDEKPSKPMKALNPWKQDKINNKVVEDVKRVSSTYQFDNKKNTKTNENVDEHLFASQFKMKKDEDVKNPKPFNYNNNPLAAFRTGTQELDWQKNLQKRPPQRGLFKRRAAPIIVEEKEPNTDTDALRKKFHCPTVPKVDESKKKPETEIDDKLKEFDTELIKRIQREIVVDSKQVSWDDIIGLEGAKKIIKESVILAIKRPDLFSGLRESSRAIMLFGVPGTGKTLIGKCIASSCDATFMSVSASSLTSKWIGESESLVRAMFTYAKIKQPCVIFFDEIDSLLEKRSEQGNETFNRIKTEFLVQLDGANALKETDKVLLIGATNRPEVIDEAILRRFTKRILVPLPAKQTRYNMFKHLLSEHHHELKDSQIDKLADYCDKYSCADISQVCKEAAMMSIRRMDANTLESMSANDLPPITPKDFLKALKIVKPTVSQETITKLDEWNSKFGSIVDNNSTIDIDDTDLDFFGDDEDL